MPSSTALRTSDSPVERVSARHQTGTPSGAGRDAGEEQRRGARGALLPHPDPAARPAARRPRSVAATAARGWGPVACGPASKAALLARCHNDLHAPP